MALISFKIYFRVRTRKCNNKMVVFTIFTEILCAHTKNNNLKIITVNGDYK
jgi:hypothetical protein